LRKIHKKSHNYFLDKGGQRGSSGGGWLSTKTKSLISGSSEEKRPKSIEETKQPGSRIKLSHHRALPRKYSGTLSQIEKNSSVDFDMINEESSSEEEDQLPKALMDLGAIQERRS
jgi:hypothetical protein